MADPKFLDESKPAPQGAEGPGGATTPPAQQFAVRGTRDDEIKRQEAIDPSEVTEVTEEEQAQYDDFVSRCIAMLSDARVPELENGKSPSDAVLHVMSNSSFSVPQALAEGAVSTIMIIHDAAKRAGKEYSPDVMFHGADEVIAALYMLGAAAGIFDGASDYAKGGTIQAPQQAMAGGAADEAQPPMAQAGGAAALPQEPGAQAQTGAIPPDTGAQEGIAPIDAEGDFTDEEYALIGEALMLSVELFGRKLLESGQITEEVKADALANWKQQINKEVETGQVDSAMFDDMDLDAIRNQIMKGGM